MQKINELIGWNFTPSSFNYTAYHLFSERTKRLYKESITKLDSMVERMPEGGKCPENYLIKDVHHKFVENYNDARYSFNKRETRVLIWALDYRPNPNEVPILYSHTLQKALGIVQQNWRDSFILSLWNVLLKNWTSLLQNRKNFKLLTNLLRRQCNKYKGNRRDIRKISNNLIYFINEKGAGVYADLLHVRDVRLNHANTLFDFKQSTLTYSYFEDVLYWYIDLFNASNVSVDKLKAIYEFLVLHNSRKVKLIACSYIIHATDLDSFMQIIKEESIRVVGDPINENKWRHDELSDYEQEQVEKARLKLNMLLNKQFIDVFFEHLIEDERRKVYWEKFIDKIHEIKFVGNKSNRDKLRKLKDLSKYVDSRYKLTRQNQNTCALIMYSKNFVFVEFSDVGPLHIYDRSNFKINLNRIDSMKDLKIWNNYACSGSYNDFYYLNREGKITHQGYWESRVNAWMERYYYD